MYYKYTPVQVFSNGSSIILALMLSLVRDDSVYELFKDIQVPNVENGEATKYVWSENYFAVTKDHNYYMLTQNLVNVDKFCKK